MDVLATPDGEGARRAAKVAADTLLRVAFADRQTADQLTGRNVTTAHETVAVQLGMSAKTVQRARRLLEVLGLAATVVEGRYLTASERLEATARHGGNQLRAASTRALIMPTGYQAGSSLSPGNEPAADLRPVENVYLPSRRRVLSSLPVKKYSPTRAHSRPREATAPRRPARTKSTKSRAVETPRDLDIQRLAAGLVRRMSWLDRSGRHIGALCGALERHQLTGRGWTPTSLLDAIDRGTRETSVRVAGVDDQRDPVGYFAWLLRRTVPAGAAAPAVELAQERRMRMRRQVAERIAEEARLARIADEAVEIDATIAAMRRRVTPADKRRG